MGQLVPNNRNKPKALFLINRDFQFRYAGVVMVVGILTTFLTAFVVLFPLYQFKILKVPEFLPSPILVVMATAVVLNSLVIGYAGIFITHRIAGPMYSMVRHFRLLGQGQWYGRMGQRKGDELRFLVRNYNEMLENMRKIGLKDIADWQQVEEICASGDLSEGEKLESINEIAEKTQAELNKRYGLREPM